MGLVVKIILLLVGCAIAGSVPSDSRLQYSQGSGHKQHTYSQLHKPSYSNRPAFYYPTKTRPSYVPQSLKYSTTPKQYSISACCPCSVKQTYPSLPFKSQEQYNPTTTTPSPVYFSTSYPASTKAPVSHHQSPVYPDKEAYERPTQTSIYHPSSGDQVQSNSYQPPLVAGSASTPSIYKEQQIYYPDTPIEVYENLAVDEFQHQTVYLTPTTAAPTYYNPNDHHEIPTLPPNYEHQEYVTEPPYAKVSYSGPAVEDSHSHQAAHYAPETVQTFSHQPPYNGIEEPHLHQKQETSFYQSSNEGYDTVVHTGYTSETPGHHAESQVYVSDQAEFYAKPS